MKNYAFDGQCVDLMLREAEEDASGGGGGGFRTSFISIFNHHTDNHNCGVSWSPNIQSIKGAVGIQYSYGLHFLNFGAFFIARIVSQSHYLF